MRRFLRAIAQLACAPTLLAALALAPACKKDEKKSDETAAEGAPAADGKAIERGKKPGAGRFKADGLSARLGLEPVTVAEVATLTPKLATAQPLGVPTQTAGGRRVTAMQCVDGTDVEKIRTEIEGELAKLGFTSVRSTPKGKRDLVTLSADKTPYRFSATVRTGPYPDCPAEKKKVKVLMSWFKRAPRNRPIPGQPGAMPGTSGAAAPAATTPGAEVPKPAPPPPSTGTAH